MTTIAGGTIGRGGTIRGTAEFKARLKAAGQTFKPYGKEWADEYVAVARPMVPVRTGRLRSSIRRRNATAKRATVEAHFSANFVNAGTKAHEITPKGAKAGFIGPVLKKRALYFTGPRGPVFTPKVDHPKTRAQPFKQRAMDEAIRRKPMADALVREWNKGA